VAALELINVNWENIFNLPNETRQHMVVALQHPEIYANRVKAVVEVSETLVQCASCDFQCSTIGIQTPQLSSICDWFHQRTKGWLHPC